MGQFENLQDAERSDSIFEELCIYIHIKYQDLGNLAQTLGGHTVCWHWAYRLLTNNMGLDGYHKFMRELKVESKFNDDLIASTFVKSELN